MRTATKLETPAGGICLLLLRMALPALEVIGLLYF